MIIGCWNTKCKLKKFFWIAIEKLTMLCLCTLTPMCDGNYEDKYSQNFDFSLTRVVCCYNFKVWEVEPPCTRVKAETGDKVLISWWAVKLGRNRYQQIKNLKYKISGSAWLSNSIWVYCSDISYVTAQKVQVRNWSQSHPQSLNHDPLEQSSVRLCHGTKTSYLGVPTRFLSQNPCLLS